MRKVFTQISSAAALCITALVLALPVGAGAKETSASATSSRHTDPLASAKAGTVQCMGVGERPLVVEDANAVLDGDRTTLWWSQAGGEQDITLDLGYPVEIRTVQIEWGKQFPIDYEVQWTADGKFWQTAFSTNGFKNTFREKSKTENKAGWTWHELNAPVTAKGLRIRCLNGSGDGYQIFDVFINGCCPFSYEPVAADALYRNPSVAPNERVQDLLKRMTLREKIRMTAGQNIFFIPGFDRFGLKPVLMCNTSAGIQIRKDMDWDYTPLKKTTAFPVAAALAATWQPELAFEAGQAIAEECRAGGQSILLGPGVNIHRTSTCGRNFEYFSEDPFLTARMGVAQVKGIQSKGVLATVKHYMANNNELVRTDSDAIIDERAMHEIYLPGFEATIREGDAKAFMSSYNWVNGKKCGEDKIVLTDILRGELGYTGMVMSDWGGTEDNTKALGSGQNLIMPQLKDFGQYLRAELAKDPAGTEKKIDEMIAPTLKVLLETGVWQRPSVLPGAVDYAAHQKMVRQIGEQAVTLLKNDGVLPLKKGQKILLVGSGKAVRNSSSGGGSGFVDGFDHVNYLDGLKAVFGNSVTHSEKPSAEAVKKADRVLFFFNMGDREGADRPFELPAETQQQIADLAANNPNVIVVASTGTAFDMPWLGKVKGLVHCLYLGQEYGASLANVLSGAVTPSGKLPFSMETAFADSPAYGYDLLDGKPLKNKNALEKANKKTFAINYSEGIFVGYRWYEAKKKPVHFPFGFGLSYTTFEMSDIKVSAKTVTKEKPVTVSVTVKNTGKVPGAEVVQLYVHDDKASVERPYRELKGFQKVFLQPGESKMVTIQLDWKALAFWDVKTHAWLAEPGTFTLLAGNSSQNVQCQASVTYK